MRIHSCMYVYVCMSVCTYVCMYVRMYVCVNVCLSVFMYVSMYVCMYVFDSCVYMQIRVQMASSACAYIMLPNLGFQET